MKATNRVRATSSLDRRVVAGLNLLVAMRGNLQTEQAVTGASFAVDRHCLSTR